MIETSIHHGVFEWHDIWQHLSPQSLYQLHLGYRGNFEKKHSSGDPNALEMAKKVEAIQSILCTYPPPQGLWRQCPCHVEDNTLHIHLPHAQPICLTFPRQDRPPYRCLTDFVTPEHAHITMMVVTSGAYPIDLIHSYVASRRYQEALIVHALYVQSAEATAEHLHAILQKNYQGKRYSFGYGACPDLGQQVCLFEILQPSTIGISLTSSHMMNPEGCVSALIFSNPDAYYFVH